jgi:hypothetical protein
VISSVLFKALHPSVFVFLALLADGKHVVAVPSTEGREGGFARKLMTLEKARPSTNQGGLLCSFYRKPFSSPNQNGPRRRHQADAHR